MQTTIILKLKLDSPAQLETLKAKARQAFGPAIVGMTWSQEAQLPPTTKHHGGLLPSKVADTLALTLERYKVELPMNYAKWKTHWRTLEPAPFGQIEGLPQLRGKCIATDGVKSILVREDGRWAFVHNLSFLPDEDQPDLEYTGKGGGPKKVRKSALEIALATYE